MSENLKETAEKTFTGPHSARASKAEIKRRVITWVILVAAFFIIGSLVPEVENLGFLTVLPSAFLLFYIFWTKRILESLVLGAMFGFILAFNTGFFWPWTDALLENMVDGDVAWVIIVCGLMGSLIALIEKAGGAFAFGDWVARKAKTGKGTLIWTWILGIVIFIDDYLDSLTSGACMIKATDKYRQPREMVAYAVDSTAAPMALLIPISTWCVFLGSLLEQQGIAAEGEGLKLFVKSIPYDFYAIAAVIIVPLVIMGIIPTFGPMKKAYQRVEKTGELAPPGSEKIDIRGGKEVAIPEKPRLLNFFIPIIVLVIATIATDVDMMAGVIITLIFTFFFCKRTARHKGAAFRHFHKIRG